MNDLKEHSRTKVNSFPSGAIIICMVVAGITILGFLLFDTETVRFIGRLIKPQESGNGAFQSIRSVSERDHLLGNPKAQVVLVEFADTECPFSKRFQETMRQIMREYGKDGRVAWVYRHFPNDSIHSKARIEAAAAECAQEVGGGYKFWEYVNRVFEITPSNNDLDLSLLPKIGQEIGLSSTYFQHCLESKKYDKRIQNDQDEAIRIGGEGTPYTILLSPRGKQTPIVGALSYEEVKAFIDAALNEK